MPGLTGGAQMRAALLAQLRGKLLAQQGRIGQMKGLPAQRGGGLHIGAMVVDEQRAGCFKLVFDSKFS